MAIAPWLFLEIVILNKSHFWLGMYVPYVNINKSFIYISLKICISILYLIFLYIDWSNPTDNTNK